MGGRQNTTWIRRVAQTHGQRAARWAGRASSEGRGAGVEVRRATRARTRGTERVRAGRRERERGRWRERVGERAQGGKCFVAGVKAEPGAGTFRWRWVGRRHWGAMPRTDSRV